MERFFKHYYERACMYDYELLELLDKSMSGGDFLPVPERCTLYIRSHGCQGPHTVKIVPINPPERPHEDDLPF
jgi:hypothetical protein